MSAEMLVEVTRNGAIESRHFGSVVICDVRGNVWASWGDIDSLIFPRSTLKPLLAINLVESGASDHYGLNDAELSLACSSHQGEKMHQDLVLSWLRRLNLTEDHLACGAVLPEHTESAHKLLAAGQTGCRSHHNCSGKHLGLLTLAVHMGLPVHDYHLYDHPVQQLSMDTLSNLADMDLRKFPIGIDGCGLPAITMPLKTLAHATARFANPKNLAKSRAKAIFRLHEAISNEPHYVSGRGTLVSELNEVTKGVVLAKTGAEGVITAALPKQGLGIALKIADGSTRARAPVLMKILDILNIFSDEQKRDLQTYFSPDIINSTGLVVGKIRPAVSWTSKINEISGKPL